MDKALNQLSVPLGQLREEVMVRIVLVYTSQYTVCVCVRGGVSTNADRVMGYCRAFVPV